MGLLAPYLLAGWCDGCKNLILESEVTPVWSPLSPGSEVPGTVCNLSEELSPAVWEHWALQGLSFKPSSPQCSHPSASAAQIQTQRCCWIPLHDCCLWLVSLSCRWAPESQEKSHQLLLWIVTLKNSQYLLLYKIMCLAAGLREYPVSSFRSWVEAQAAELWPLV